VLLLFQKVFYMTCSEERQCLGNTRIVETSPDKMERSSKRGPKTTELMFQSLASSIVVPKSTLYDLFSQKRSNV
jgi:hypothetical protein